MITPELREYAETPDRFVPLVAGSSVARYDDGQICVLQGPNWASGTAPLVAPDELDELLALTRSLIPRGKLVTWWIGPAARPTDIVERLRGAGLVEPTDRVGHLIALALTEEPAAAPPDVEERRIETFDDFVAARE